MAVSEHQSCSTVPCRLSLCGMCNGFVEHNEVCGCLYRGRVWGACSAIDREPTHGKCTQIVGDVVTIIFAYLLRMVKAIQRPSFHRIRVSSIVFPTR